jgi:hypothetical protein
LDEYGWVEDEDEDNEDERHTVGSKRKASAQPARGSKKAKAGRPPSHTYQLRLRCREMRGRSTPMPMSVLSNSKTGILPALWARPIFPPLGEQYPSQHEKFLMHHVHSRASGWTTQSKNPSMHE